MKPIRILYLAGVSLLLTWNAYAQGFVNLRFESTTITPVVFPGGTRYTATVPGWTWTPGGNPVNGDPNSVGFNDLALSSAAVNLEGTNMFAPYSAIQGNYSIFMQGASYNGGRGSTIGQTGQIPANAKSITYWGGNFQVSFDGQPLSFTDMSNALTYAVWTADISAYAGQTGELLLTCAEHNAGMLDNIQFSSLPVPEPSTFSLFGICILLLCWRMKPPNKSLQATRDGALSSASRFTLVGPACLSSKR